MKKLMDHKQYALGLLFAAAILAATIGNIMTPCGFKWGG
jgi:hypothetical protein